ncbi:hypothetical protein QBC45DRAFT_475678 [Copromyces sp. CBS 386.78]|nr:hypothetical protein QBC45DRAFT_475678 [Copromyces sp. CBS 386.78]
MCNLDWPIYVCGKEKFPSERRRTPCARNCGQWQIGRYDSNEYCRDVHCGICIQMMQQQGRIATAPWTDPNVSKRTDPRYSHYYDEYGVVVPAVSGGGGGGAGGQVPDPGYGNSYGGGDPSAYDGAYGGQTDSYGGYGGGGGGQVNPYGGYGGGGGGGQVVDPGYGGQNPIPPPVPAGFGGGGGGGGENPDPKNPFAGGAPLPAFLREDEEKKGSKKSKGKKSSHRKHR